MTKYCDTVTDASQIAGKHRVHKFQAPTGHGYNRGSSCLNHLDLSQSIYGQNVEKVYTGSGTPTTTRKSEQNYYKRAQNETSNHDTGGRVKPNTGTSLFRAQVIGMFMISSQCQVGWNGPVLLEVEFVESSSKILSVHVNKFSDKSFVAQAPIFRIRFASPTNGYRCFTIVPGPLFKSQTYAYWAFKFRDDEHVEFERILKNSQSLQI
ncbi:MAG: hypothetical protein MMC33_002720 [Icmadophila ericetorum]|nr:hypothetical protein [Icmadophila ericetorum]